MNNAPDPDKAKMLAEQIQGFLEYYWRLHINSSWMSSGLVVLGIFLGLAVTGAGFLGYGIVAGFLGLAVTLFISLQNAFNFSEKAEFYRVIHNEAKILRDRLRYKVYCKEELEGIVDSFASLRRRAAEKLPRGKGIEVVKEIHAKHPSDNTQS